MVTGRHRELDTTGTYCPVPILLTAREMELLAPGACLEVVGDDPGILEDMPVWCESSGHRLERMERVGERIVCLIRKRPEGPGACPGSGTAP